MNHFPRIDLDGEAAAPSREEASIRVFIVPPASIDGRAFGLSNPRLLEYHESGGKEEAEITPMTCSDESTQPESRMTHEIDFETCYVTQRGRGVAVVEKGELDAREMLAPPKEWGDSWAWNVLADGSGIYLRRT